MPQDWQGHFRTEVFERYQRSEKALVGALAEMYVQGVSTRKVKAITEEFDGHVFSPDFSASSNGQLPALPVVTGAKAMVSIQLLTRTVSPIQN